MTDQPLEQTAVATPTQIVESFLYAIRDENYDAMLAALDDDVVYHNVGMPIIRGGRRTVNTLRRGLELPRAGFDVKIHRIAAEGTSVLTERTDVILFGPLRIQFWVCGVFEVRDGRITLWRDYFDFLDIVKATVRGLIALAVPSLKPGF
ncbi:limonene-1,2-epoxide hydrolase family protein [Mycobacterium sp.]|uniref:limonene-1,2-epoxide hydrolase family protein n=1 Tax=Mycobacterium sp. TaxID=1785 RepID=UPI002B7F1137|nr:limonene-1,2-epoxide hydrolase family protein [Mycobacterium sp.]HME48000.1 limonene-1,2-epoxide hydrolase family protein [Mycobacterium sp.]